MRGQPPVGSMVAGYRLISLVGEGATGAVYLAERDGTDERVALKLLDPELAHERALPAAPAARVDDRGRPRHDHVVPIFDFGETEEDGLYLPCATWTAATCASCSPARVRSSPSRALGLLGQVGRRARRGPPPGARAPRREAGERPRRAHRDGEHAFLGDFGLVKHASSVSSLTGDHAFVGTIAYVSPEQIKGEALDGRATSTRSAASCTSASRDRRRSTESELAVVYAHLHERTAAASDRGPGCRRPRRRDPRPRRRSRRTATRPPPS